MSNLQQRIISAIVLGAAVLALTWIGGTPFRALAVIAGAAILYEWYAMAGIWAQLPRAGLHAVGYAAIGLAVLGGYGHAAVLTAFGVVTGIALIAAFVDKNDYWIAGGLAYAAMSAIALAGLRGDGADGLVTLLFLFAVVWSTDIFAYFNGRSLGGPKLAPRISPNKTWSGAIGGTAAAIAAGLAVVMYFTPGRGGLALPLLVLILSAGSQIGDLFESWIKRHFGRKDSSQLIPGHGGVMDRVDGLVVAAMLLYVITLMSGWGITGTR